MDIRRSRIDQTKHTNRAVSVVLLGWMMLVVILSLPGCRDLPDSPDRIVVAVDGTRETLETQAETVQQVLSELDITLGTLDRVQPPETAQVHDGLVITVTRVLERVETITETVAFGRQVIRDASLPEGESRLLQAGKPGIHERVYRITEEGGQEINRTLIKDAVSQPPEDEVMLIGTQPRVTTFSIPGTLAYLDHQDAWVMRNSNANTRRITTFGDLDGRIFTLSPDGKQLLFTRALTDSEHFNALWLVNTVEVDAEPLAIDLNDLLWAEWSPDGARIAWTTAEPIERAPGWRGENDLWSAQINSSRGTLTSKREILKPEAGGGYGWWGTRYQWAPDGEKLAYATPDEVGIVDLQEREKTALGQFPAYRTYSSWAWTPTIAWYPEGALIATVIHGPATGTLDPEESPVFDLWAIEVTGAYSVELASEVGMWTTPQTSPEGKTLLFGKANIPYQSHLSSYTLCTIDRDGSNRHCFYPQEGEAGIEIPSWTWSPDATIIAFILRDNLYLLPAGETRAIPGTDKEGVTIISWR